MIKLPGLIDVHVHLREPGQNEKEDLASGTAAALAGGFTTVLDMPNTSKPITTIERLDEKRNLGEQKALSNIGFYYGSLGDNLDTFEEASQKAVALKLYLNITTGGYVLDLNKLAEIYERWPKDKPIVLHTEESTIDLAIQSLDISNRHIHVAHMPSQEILTKIMRAKDIGRNVTCGVTPHHLFLNEEDGERIGAFAQMKPSLKSRNNVSFLWDNLDAIDLIESDHAPHTQADKKAGAFGIPGLESTLPLLLQAEQENRLSRKKLLDLTYNIPAKLFNLEVNDETYIEISEESYHYSTKGSQSKAKWSPFEGRQVFGRVRNIVLNNEIVMQDGVINHERAIAAKKVL
ncbi:amidohydrolase family protein [Candidatus Saccharibacteria bacterium]|nr:amidohydrolase family protein [Candidatus Saccharibacteria bacterium]